MKPLAQLKSSAYYKKWAHRIGTTGLMPTIFVGLIFASVIAVNVGTSESNRFKDLIKANTSYYSYVEEKTAEYEESYNNGDISESERNSLVENLKDRNDYFDNYASAEEKEKYTALSNEYLTRILGIGLPSCVAPAMLGLVTIWTLEHSLDKKSKRAEFKEKQEANDTIKTNYDPKYKDLNDYNDYELI